MISNIDSNDILQEAKNLYKVNHLPFPWIPDIYTQDILKISEWVYGTRINVRSPYATDSYIEELLTGEKTNYVVFGHSGHGIMSYGLHFYLVTDSLALFLQHSWGNADSNPTKDVESIQKDYLLAEQLIKVLETTNAIEKSKRLIIYQSNLRLVSKWALLADTDDEILWNQSQLGKVLETVLQNFSV